MTLTLHLAHCSALESPELQRVCLGAILRPLESIDDEAQAL